MTAFKWKIGDKFKVKPDTTEADLATYATTYAYLDGSIFIIREILRDTVYGQHPKDIYTNLIKTKHIVPVATNEGF